MERERSSVEDDMEEIGQTMKLVLLNVTKCVDEQKAQPGMI